MRARSLKPGFFRNEELAKLPFETRLLFAGLWCIADREGRLEDRPMRIRADVFPYENVDVEAGLGQLREAAFLERYEVDGRKYIQILAFTKHQTPHHKEVESEIPPAPGQPAITRYAYNVPQDMRDEVFERDSHVCLKCGARDDLAIDHIVPLARGGDNRMENLQTLCKRCNSSKGDTTKDYRKFNVEPTLKQCSSYVDDPCPSDSLTPDTLTPSDASHHRRSRASLALPAAIPADAWADWHNFRNRRKGWTPKARELSLGTLIRLQAAGHDPSKVINRSIERGWTGLFPLPENERHAGSTSGRKLSAVEQVQQAIIERRAQESDGQPPAAA